MICENCGKEIDSFIGTAEFAKRVGLSASTILRAVENGEIKAFKYGGNSVRAGKIVIPESELKLFREKYLKPATE